MTTLKVITDEEIWQVLGAYLFPVGIPPMEGMEEQAVTRFIGGYPDHYIEPMTLEWEHDFTEDEEAEWSKMMRRARRMVVDDDFDALAPHIAVLRQWRNRTGTTTNAKRDAALDAVVEILRLTLKDDDDG